MKACEALKTDEINSLITAPINKLNIKNYKNDFIGHTELLGKEFEGVPLMMMVSDIMKITPVQNVGEVVWRPLGSHAGPCWLKCYGRELLSRQSPRRRRRRRHLEIWQPWIQKKSSTIKISTLKSGLPEMFARS